MFLTCQVDLPVAITMKSAQAQCFWTGITLTLSALTSLKTFSTSWSSRSSFFLKSAVEQYNARLRLGNPNFHSWRSAKTKEGDSERGKYQDYKKPYGNYHRSNRIGRDIWTMFNITIISNSITKVYIIIFHEIGEMSCIICNLKYQKDYYIYPCANL